MKTSRIKISTLFIFAVLLASSWFARGAMNDSSSRRGTPTGSYGISVHAPAVSPLYATSSIGSIDMKNLPQVGSANLGGAAPNLILPLKAGASVSSNAPQPLATTSNNGLTFSAPFAGIKTSSLQGGWIPPDVSTAAGRFTFAETVNNELNIWNRTNNKLISAVGYSSFWGTGTNFITDPSIVYDLQSGQYFTTMADVTTGNTLIAWTINSPTSPSPLVWNFVFGGLGPYVTECNSKGLTCFGDQPVQGLSATGSGYSATGVWTVDVNVFGCATGCNPTKGSFQFSEAIQINLHDMVNCNNACQVHFNSFDSADFSVHPADSIDPSSTQYYVDASSCCSTTATLFSFTGIPGVSCCSLSQTTFTIANTGSPAGFAGIPQPNTATKLNPDDARVRDVKFSGDPVNGGVWFALTDGCVQSDGVTRSCVRLDEIDITGSVCGAPLKLCQDFDVSVVGQYEFYPALSITTGSTSGCIILKSPICSGNVLVVFGYASGLSEPSLAVTGQGRNAMFNTFRAPDLVVSGPGPSLEGRYGDYFGAGTDPVNPFTVWLAGEWEQGNVQSTSFKGWSTSIFQSTVICPC